MAINRLRDSEISYDEGVELGDDEQVLLTIATGGTGTLTAVDPEGLAITVDLRRVDPDGDLSLVEMLELLVEAARRVDERLQG